MITKSQAKAGAVAYTVSWWNGMPDPVITRCHMTGEWRTPDTDEPKGRCGPYTGDGWAVAHLTFLDVADAHTEAREMVDRYIKKHQALACRMAREDLPIREGVKPGQKTYINMRTLKVQVT